MPESLPDAFLRTLRAASSGLYASLPPILPADLLEADMVLVRTDLAPFYAGPYLVLERFLRYFKLQMGGLVDTESTIHLKAAHFAPDTPAALPPLNRRPPSSLQ